MDFPLQDDARPFLLLGHRGSPRRFRENTVRSLTAALEEGAEGFECDLRLSADGRIVIFHDHTSGGRTIASMTLDEIRDREPQIATLEDVLNLARGVVVLEIKTRDVTVPLLAMLPERVAPNLIVSSFDHRIVRDLAKERPDLPLGIVVDAYLIGTGAYARSLGARWCFPHYRFADLELVRDCGAAGVGVIPWTANTVEDWTRLADIGCAGMITDLPAEAGAWRSRRAGWAGIEN